MKMTVIIHSSTQTRLTPNESLNKAYALPALEMKRIFLRSAPLILRNLNSDTKADWLEDIANNVIRQCINENFVEVVVILLALMLLY